MVIKIKFSTYLIFANTFVCWIVNCGNYMKSSKKKGIATKTLGEFIINEYSKISLSNFLKNKKNKTLCTFSQRLCPFFSWWWQGNWISFFTPIPKLSLERILLCCNTVPCTEDVPLVEFQSLQTLFIRT